MPDWTAPFHLPKLTDEEFARKKAEYIAKNGYSITIPGLSDIFKVKTEEPLSYQENIWYKAKEWDRFSAWRLEEIRKMKQKRKDRYLAMLASPTPAIVQNAGSIMTAIDDFQDATVTLAAVGSLARQVAPKLLGKLLRKPVGLLLVASDALNMVQDMGRRCLTPFQGKKGGEQITSGSPKTLKQKLKKRMWSAARIPKKSDWIQGLQTSDQVFGFGICLGPIIGLINDIVWGSIRSTPGTFMKIKLPVPEPQHWYKIAQGIMKAEAVFLGLSHYTDDEEILLAIIASHLASQVLMTYQMEWNPLEMVEDFTNLEIRAPIPWNPLTIDVIKEGPVDPWKVIGWPQTGQEWSPILDIIDMTQEPATDNLNRFLQRNKNSWNGWVGGLCASQAASQTLACLEGEDDVFTERTAWSTAAITMLKHGYMLDPDQPYRKFELFESFLKDCEDTLWNPTMENILEFCGSPWNNIKLIRSSF